MKRAHPPTLRGIVSAATAIVAIVAVAVASALVLLTTSLHRTSTKVNDGIESVRLAQEAQIDLLLHVRATDPLVRAALESRLRDKLERLPLFVGSRDEGKILDDARFRVDSYLRDREPAAMAEQTAVVGEQAYRALGEMVDVNRAQARGVARRIERLDDLSNVLGFGATALILSVAVAVLWWVRTKALRPVFALADAMKRFGLGDVSVRATESGAAELREMAAHFNDMATTLARQREAQLVFLAGVAHDLRNPVSAIDIALRLSTTGPALPPEPRMRELLATMTRQMSRLGRMIDDFLDVSSIESGRLALHVQEVDLVALGQQVVALFADVSPRHHIVLELADGPITVRGDATRIEQVLVNLISNAIKYSPRGGRVTVGVDSDRDGVKIRVRDEGVGIDEHERPHLFEPFRRGGLSKESVPGVGLGLFVVKRIVEAHDGRIDVSSAPQQGTIFEVSLPHDRS